MKVKDLMLSVSEYAVVDENATLRDAVIALEQSKPKGGQPHRAVLVVDKKGKVVGKLGHLAFLKALEPKYNELGDINLLVKAGVSPTFIDSMSENLRIWGTGLEELCKQARKVKVRDVMHPAAHSIDENALVTEAIHKLIVWNTLSLLVTRKDEIVGILRLADVYAQVAVYIKTKESNRWAKPEDAK